MCKTLSKDLTPIEMFVKEHLTHINLVGGEIEYSYNGDNYEEGFVDNPLVAIRMAIRRIEAWEKGEEI